MYVQCSLPTVAAARERNCSNSRASCKGFPVDFIIASGTKRVRSDSSFNGISPAGKVCLHDWQRHAGASGTSTCMGRSGDVSPAVSCTYSGKHPMWFRQHGQRSQRAESGPAHRAHWQTNHKVDNRLRRSIVLTSKFIPLPTYENVRSSPALMGLNAWYCSLPSLLKDHEQFGEQLCENFEPKTKIPVKSACSGRSSSLWMFKSTI
mmetsp:Transcript_113243/g.327134  ORF Transcript_113243/g.327134 Transcript_113243/m.327134 type:complete len:206 (+) Transcript_113243:371-988(+)